MNDASSVTKNSPDELKRARLQVFLGLGGALCTLSQVGVAIFQYWSETGGLDGRLLIAGALFLLTLGLLGKSRFCAIALLLYVIIYALVNIQHSAWGPWWLLRMITIWLQVQGVQGTFLYARLKRAALPESA